MRYFFLCSLAVASFGMMLLDGSRSGAVEAARTMRFSLDLGSYRGYWRIDNGMGTEVTHDECFTQRVCREMFKALPEGDYALVLSQEPQSAPVRFKVAGGSVVVTSGSNLAKADGNTLRLQGLRRVNFDLNGYRGAWSLNLWKGAEATGFFKRDGQIQTIELFPDTTYTLNIGPIAAERFQIGREDRMILIDDNGVVRVPAETAGRLVFQTIDAVFYPVPQADTAQWVLDGLPPSDGRGAHTGPRILRLVQGATYKVSEPATGAETQATTFLTGKACNMVPQVVKLPRSTLTVMPISVSCTPAVSPETGADSGLLRRNIAP